MSIHFLAIFLMSSLQDLIMVALSKETLRSVILKKLLHLGWFKAKAMISFSISKIKFFFLLKIVSNLELCYFRSTV